MNRFDLAAALAVAAALAPACSNARPEPSTSQAQPLAPADGAPPPVPPAGRATSAPAPAVAPLALGATASGPSTATLALGDPNERATLRAIALAAAAHAGVSSPSAIHAVASHDHQSAQYALCGAILPDHAPVYVLKVLGGPFTVDHHPPGRPAPQGRVLTLTIDAQTHQITDVGYVDNEPDFGKIGLSTADLSAP